MCESSIEEREEAFERANGWTNMTSLVNEEFYTALIKEP